MKTLAKLLILVLGIYYFYGCSSSFNGIDDSSASNFNEEIDQTSGNVYVYSEQAIPPIPTWYISTSESLLDDLIEDEEKCGECIIKASGNYTIKASDDNGIEGANKIAWANARKKFFDSWIENFNATSQTTGSNADSRISQEESFYKFISIDESGISPLTEVKTFYAYNKTTKTYTCYGLYYVRADELNKRLSMLNDTKERSRYEKAVQQYLYGSY